MSTSNIDQAIAAVKADIQSQRQNNIKAAAAHQIAADDAKKAAEEKTPSDSVLRQSVTFDAVATANQNAVAAKKEASNVFTISFLTLVLVAFAIGAAIWVYAQMNSSVSSYNKAQTEFQKGTTSALKKLKDDVTFIRKNMVTKDDLKNFITKDDLPAMEERIFIRLGETGCRSVSVCTPVEIEQTRGENCEMRSLRLSNKSDWLLPFSPRRFDGEREKCRKNKKYKVAPRSTRQTVKRGGSRKYVTPSSTRQTVESAPRRQRSNVCYGPGTGKRGVWKKQTTGGYYCKVKLANNTVITGEGTNHQGGGGGQVNAPAAPAAPADKGGKGGKGSKGSDGDGQTSNDSIGKPDGDGKTST